jgi:hypothetical protein
MNTQPAPIANDSTPIVDLVVADLAERKRVGIERYGVPLQAFNGRDALWDLYEELLDACQYIRQAIEERNVAKAAEMVAGATGDVGVGAIPESVIKAVLAVQGWQPDDVNRREAAELAHAAITAWGASRAGA